LFTCSASGRNVSVMLGLTLVSAAAKASVNRTGDPPAALTEIEIPGRGCRCCGNGDIHGRWHRLAQRVAVARVLTVADESPDQTAGASAGYSGLPQVMGDGFAVGELPANASFNG